PFGDALHWNDGAGHRRAEALVIAAPVLGTYRLQLVRSAEAPDDARYALSVVVPAADGSLRQIVFDLSAGDAPAFSFAAHDHYQIALESAGTVAATQDHTVTNPPAHLLGVVQQEKADVLGCEGEPDLVAPVGRVVAALFSGEVGVAGAQDVSHYAIDNNQVI